MKRKGLLVLIGVCCFFIGMFSCAKKEEISEEDQAARAMIAAYTSGAISREGTIRVRFADDMVDSSILNTPLERPPLSFKPKIKGTAVWTDARTLEFRPVKRLSAGQEYAAAVRLADIMETVGKAKQFRFTFSIMKQSFEITLGGLQAARQEDQKWQQLTGTIVTADTEGGINIEKMLKALQAGKGLNISWTHAENRLDHSFVIGGILRGDDPSEVVLRWDGDPIGVDKRGESTVPVPPISTFAVSEIKAIQGKEQYIEVRFTDPLRKDQDLRGLITVDDRQDIRFTIERNVVRVYSTSPWQGSMAVKVEREIRNIMGHRLKTSHEAKVFFEEIKPQVRFVGKGVILPTTQGLTIPIEAVNLRAVVVEAMRIYEKNIPQFLQVNDLAGERELKRVGRVIWKKTIPFNFTPANKNRWVRYGLDASPLIRDEKGGLYRITLSFKRRHIVYDCPATKGNEEDEDAEMTSDDVNEETESSYWDSYEEEDEDYSWGEYYDQRKNPCHPGYYRTYHDHTITVTRNLFVSDVGLIAKKGSDNSVFIAATDIKTAQPLAGTEVTLRDYQQQMICTGTTNKDGTVILNAERQPFLVVARKGDQIGYLKLDDGSALSVSHFDVAGASVQKGLKGFIYGERGVWRPGDPIYLTFILMDSNHRLPETHPVILELRNPKGQLVKKIVRTRSLNGFYCFEVKTDPDAPTGNWRAQVKVGGVTFEKILKVETVMPNRLKIKLDFGDKKSLSEGKITGELSAAWLHGAIAKNLKADVEMSFNPCKTSFPKYEEYEFDDPVRIYETESQTIFKGELDDKGRAQLSADIKTENISPGMLTAHFKTRVFEPGGAFSIDRASIPYHPYKRYIGIRVPKGDKARGMLLTDTQHTVSIIALDTQGNTVSAGQVEVTMYKIRWRWWWEKGEESLADYVGSSSYRPIKTDTVQIKNGQGEWRFELKYPDWGRYLIRVRDLNGNHITGKIVYIDWPGWAGRAQKDMSGGATVLTFSADKEEYKVGEKVAVTIPTGQKGRGLVSIESGSKTLETRWIEAGEEATRFEFLATEAMAPNVYVHVTLLQPHLQAGNDLPIRMYGVIPVKVEDPGTRLKPVIDAPDVFRPEESTTIKVSEATGKPMTYTVAIVDEGLLDLTRFATPDPWGHFYEREALGVKTWDLFDIVAGAYGGTLEQLLAIGGGEAGEIEGQKKATRFPPMVRFLGPFELSKNKKNTHKIDIPQYVGSVRIMVVAGQDGAFGSGQRTVFVRKPLMVLGTLPRVLGPDEEVELPVSVFAMEKDVKDVSVTVKTTGALAVEGTSQKTLSFSEPGDQLLNFRLRVGSQIGIATVSIQATSGAEKASQKIELDVRMPGGSVIDVIDSTLSSDKTWKQEVTFPGITGTNTVMLEVSRIPPVNLGRRLTYLIRYPHGCAEQITSAVFPQLYLDKLIELSPDKQDAVQKNIRAGIERLRIFQNASGGFAFWPGADETDDWISNYVGHFLVEAKRVGYVVPQGVIEQWTEYQRKRALSWVTGPAQSELIQAYRVYTLALASAAELGAMNRLKETKDLPTAARWRLAAAYQLAGQPEAAEHVVKNAGVSISTYRELSNTYGSELRDKAMVLESLCLMNQMKKAEPLVKAISEELSSGKWLSTQTTAYALIAMARYAGIAGDGEKMKFSFSWNQGEEKKISSASPVVQMPLPVNDKTKGILEIKNMGIVTLYPRLILEGIPPIGSEKAAENGMAMTVKYLTPKGDTLDPSQLEQGTDFVAEVTIKNIGRGGRYDEVALAHIFPSGWEIHNARLDISERSSGSDFDYQDIRDDRIYTYFDIDQDKAKTFRVLLNASYLGKFYLPMVMTEVMYDGTINARIPGRWITVVRPGATK